MALATTCPSCKTSFKVLSDQLKLRRGMVRCGICQQVFSGVEYLRYVSDARVAPSADAEAEPATVADDLHTAFFLPETRMATEVRPPVPPASERRPPRRPARGRPGAPAGSPDWPGIPDDSPLWADRQRGQTDGPAELRGSASAARTGREPGDPQATEADDVWPSTMIWPRPAEPGPASHDSRPGPPAASVLAPVHAPEVVPRRAPHPPATPPRTTEPSAARRPADPDDDAGLDAADEDEAVDFFGRSSNPAFDFDLPPRGVWIAAGLLALLLIGQVTLGARDVIAARLPAARGFLEAIATPFGLQVGMPVRPEAITIESFDLARAPEGQSRFKLNMLLRNRSGMQLQWPSIELTLTDSTGGILVRKAILATSYLRDPAAVAAGMPAHAEHPIRLTLEAADIVPSGYSAVLFYH